MLERQCALLHLACSSLGLQTPGSEPCSLIQSLLYSNVLLPLTGKIDVGGVIGRPDKPILQCCEGNWVSASGAYAAGTAWSWQASPATMRRAALSSLGHQMAHTCWSAARVPLPSSRSVPAP